MRFWPRVIAVAFGAAALIGAAQLGLVYGLDAMRLDDRSFTGAENDWNIQLTWIAWFAMVAVVGGAGFAMGHGRLLARRQGLANRHTDGTSLLVRLVASFSAGLGAVAAVFPLTVYPAVNAKLPTPYHPALTMALTVVVAVAAGVVFAALVAGHSPMSTSVALFVFAAWVLAAVSLADTAPVLGRFYLEPARLGVLDIGDIEPVQRAYYSMPALAVVIGIIAGITGWVRRDSRAFIMFSGAAGPLLIALAYLMGGPGLAPREITNQADAYIGAMASVVIGLIPTLFIAVLPRRRSSSL